MKTTAQRMMIAIIALVFAVSTPSCKKESTITPGDVSFKAKSIITKENGIVVRTQTYEYDSNNKITKYVSAEGNRRDSMELTGNNVLFKSRIDGSTKTTETLKFNIDKSLSEISETNFVSSTTETLFTDFSAISATTSGLTALINNSAEIILSFKYTEGNLSALSSNGGHDKMVFTYLNNAAFQKGINELPVVSMSLKYHKIIEQEDRANYAFSNKLINTVTLSLDAVIKRIHSYAYIRDAQGRIVTINETISFPSSSTADKILVHTITY